MQDSGSTVVLAALISSAAALLGALGSQGIAAWSNLLLKKRELVYKNKSEAYAAFHMRAADFALDPKNLKKYLQYLSAYEKALMFASDEVAAALSDKTGVNVAAQRLRSAEDEAKLMGIQVKEWHDAMTRVAMAMRADLGRYT